VCLNAVFKTRKVYRASYQHATALVLAGKKEEARKLLTQETLPRLLIYHAAFSAFAAFQTTEMNQELGKRSRRYRKTRRRAVLAHGTRDPARGRHCCLLSSRRSCLKFAAARERRTTCVA